MSKISVIVVGLGGPVLLDDIGGQYDRSVMVGGVLASQFASNPPYVPELKTNSLIIDSGSGNVAVPASWEAGELKVEIWGGGGGAAGWDSVTAFPTQDLQPFETIYNGNPGDSTSISTLSMLANGGGGSSKYVRSSVFPVDQGTNGAGGTASGGDTNTTGAAGSSPVIYDGGTYESFAFLGGIIPLSFPVIGVVPGKGGGSDPKFVYGGYPSKIAQGTTGDAPGGGGNGAAISSVKTGSGSGGGGAGGYSCKTWQWGDSDAPTPGDLWAYVIGAGGAGGNGFFDGGAGAGGRLKITWQTWYGSESASDSDAGHVDSSDSFADTDPGASSFEGDYPSSVTPEELPYHPGDYLSIYSRGSRGAVENGNRLISIATSLTNEFTNISAGINNNYGVAAGDGPYYGGQSVVAGVTQIIFQLAEAQVLTGYKCFGVGTVLNEYKLWNFEASTNGVDWVALASGVAFYEASGTKEVLFFNRKKYAFYRWTATASTTIDGGRLFTELELKVNHSSLDSNPVAQGVTVTTSLRETTAGTFNDLFDGNFNTLNHGASPGSIKILKARLSESGESSDDGEFIRFHFPRHVGMRDATLQVNDVAEALESSGDTPFSMGIWRWQYSDDGATWTDYGDEFEMTPAGQSEALFDPMVRDEYEIHRYWQMVSTRGHIGDLATGAGFEAFQFTFNLYDPLLEEASDSDYQSDIGDSSGSDSGFGVSDSDFPSSIDSASDSDSGASDSGSESGASSSGESEVILEPNSSVDLGSERDPDRVPILQAMVVSVVC